jgi:hypothetical protein
MIRSEAWLRDAEKISRILKLAPDIDKNLRIQKEEFNARQQKVINALKENGLDAAVVYSDEHYNGDVPYLGGCTNITIEPIAGVIGANGFHILAGLEGGYVAEQLTERSGAKVHKVEMLKFVDEDYPVEAERVEDVFEEAAGKKPKHIGILTPKAVFPVGLYEFLREYVGKDGSVVDAQKLYYKIKYEKSENEMKLTEQASLICDVMLAGMLSVMRPGMLETQVSQWGYAIAQELGAEEFGFDIMVNANEASRTLIGKALNRVINEGDIVHLGVSPKRDGLTACERVSVVCVDSPEKLTEPQKFWFDFIEQAYEVGYQAYEHVAKNNLPAKLQEQALVDYFKKREADVVKRIGRQVDLAKQKPYTGTHSSGYTECQEFYGAITLDSYAPLGSRIVTMLDVAVRGVGNKWNDIILKEIDYLVVEKTLGKFGHEVKTLNKLPVNVQKFVGNDDVSLYQSIF